ncbi:MAG: hypothetical protein ABEH40_00930 [Haloferacaceae archaeon]
MWRRPEPSGVCLDPAALADALARFGGTPAERRVVARQARDLAADGRVERDRGRPLTAADVVANLADAPDGGPAARWNWWLGALEVAHGGYREFAVRRIPE